MHCEYVVVFWLLGPEVWAFFVSVLASAMGMGYVYGR